MPLTRRLVAGQTSTNPQKRKNITFTSHGETISAWLYQSEKSKSDTSYKGPAIVLAHGLGAVKDMRLDAYSERFQAEGYTCLAFDYRYSGESTGKPRGLINVEKQLEDWAIAIEYVRSLSYVDAESIGIFGSSFGGGNVIRVAAKDPTIKAVISQCPFTSGFHSSLTTGYSVLPKLLYYALKDVAFGTLENPVTVPLAGEPGEGE
jgi:cephalosporin-C deacetylase-like acetyl esterase